MLDALCLKNLRGERAEERPPPKEESDRIYINSKSFTPQLLGAYPPKSPICHEQRSPAHDKESIFSNKRLVLRRKDGHGLVLNMTGPSPQSATGDGDMEAGNGGHLNLKFIHHHEKSTTT